MSLISPRYAAVGKRITEIREDRGLTQVALAAAIGVSPYKIFRFEHGRTRIAIEYLEKIATALRCRVDDLLAPPGSAFCKRRRRLRRDT
jgi:transcriptional regulator with XRE-family HTH domain